MKLLTQGRLAVASALAGVLLVAIGRGPETAPVSLSLTGLGAVFLLLALWGLWDVAAGFRHVLEDLQSRQAKT